MKKTIKLLMVSAALYAGFAFAGNDSQYNKNVHHAATDTIIPTDTLMPSTPDTTGLPADTTMPETPLPDTTQLL